MGSTEEQHQSVVADCVRGGDKQADCESVYSNEKPQHTVYLDAYWIDRTEVTNGMYAKCVADGDCDEPRKRSSNSRDSYYGNSQYDDYPVIYVNWYDAKVYCMWAGRRLLSEAEWEKAARGKDGRIYPWGNLAPAGNLVNFADKNISYDWSDKTADDGYADTAPVGSYPDGKSFYGALDMAGNVWEWVADWFGGRYYSNAAVRNPTGPSSGDYRVLRGGSWLEAAWKLRAFKRGWDLPSNGDATRGFRCAR